MSTLTITLVRQPSNGCDDGAWNSAGTTYLADTDGYFGKLSGNTFNNFIRFPAIDIAQGTTITSATLHITGGGTYAVDVAWGQYDEAPNITAATTAATLNALSLGSATSWANPTGDLDQTTQVQGLINRAGWTSGSSMIVTLKTTGSPASYSMFTVYEKTGYRGNSPKLTIVYDKTITGGGGILRSGSLGGING